MTEQDFLDLVTRSGARTVLEVMAEIPEKERRKFAGAAHAAFKKYQKAWWANQVERTAIPRDIAKDGDALCVAVLATGVPSEIAGYGWRGIPQNIKIADVLKALRPSWIDRWAEAMVEDNPRMLGTVQELHQLDLCRLPDTDAYILGYYAHQRTTADLVSDGFLQRDVWRFFEVEGGGEFSLAAHDKYSGNANAWATVLMSLCAKGTLDRDRLLDASLDALERDFGQFRAGWYSRFHLSLAPTSEELTARVAQYLRLLGSMVPPTVSFALKMLKQIDKISRLAPGDLLAAIEPALQARQKSSVVAALQLLKSCASQHPDRSTEIAIAAASALISEAGEVQERALDLIEQLDQTKNPDILGVLDEYRESATPSAKLRLSELLATQTADIETVTAYPVPALKNAQPVGSAEEAVAVHLELLEDCADPFLIERAIDGLARFGAAAGPFLSPLAKRAGQVRKRLVDGGYSPGKYFQRPICATALAWASGNSLEEEFQPFLEERYWGHRPVQIEKDSFEGMFAARSGEILGLFIRGMPFPCCLHLPTTEAIWTHPNSSHVCSTTAGLDCSRVSRTSSWR